MECIPVLSVTKDSIAEAWETAVLRLYTFGYPIATQYDKPGDPPSLDATMIITIRDPVCEPMIHRSFPGGLEDLQEYVMEVCDGIKDHLIRNPLDPEDKRWEYTYHQRLFKYIVGEHLFDQIEMVAHNLAKAPHTRRAQAITWKVWEDNSCYDPACLQSIWCRILKDENDIWWLNTNVRFRSNDAYKAAFMNIFALVMLQQKIAARVSELSGKEVRLGRYVHMADSFHLYGSYFEEFENTFLALYHKRPLLADRTYSYVEYAKAIMDEAIPMITEKAKNMR